MEVMASIMYNDSAFTLPFGHPSPNLGESILSRG